MKYKLISDSVVACIDDDGTCRMSCSINHPDYLIWLAEGNTPQPADPVVPAIPEVVTMRQARLALLHVGLLEQVNTAVSTMSGEAADIARIEWEFSSTVERNRPLVQSLTSVMGLSELQLDDLFRLAATL